MSYPMKRRNPAEATTGRQDFDNSNAVSALYQFRTAMLNAGIGAPDEIVADGTLHRFRGIGDKHGHRNAWYVFHDDLHPAGAFGSWRTGLQSTWSGRGERLDAGEAARLVMLAAIARAETRAKHEALQAKAAAYARRWWALSPPAHASHPYLVAKGVKAYGLRQQDDFLMVPLTDSSGVILNLQRIYPDGAKRFLSGGRITGLHSAIGTPDGSHLLLCEGWATGATLHAETGFPVWCAMNCGNLLPVAKDARRAFPDADIVVCGDDDRHTEGNPGRTKATAAAIAIGARLAFPTFRDGEVGTDFNDMAQREAAR